MSESDASAKVHTHRMRVYFHHCDHAGHTNMVAYMAFLEAAREELLHELGLLEASIDPSKLRIITARVWIDYLAESSYHDELDIFTRVSRIGEKSFELGQEVARVKDGVTAAKAGCVLVSFDYEKNASVPLSQEDRRALERYA